MIYKNYKIEQIEFGYFAATNLEDCDEDLIFSKSIDELKIEIDEKL